MVLVGISSNYRDAIYNESTIESEEDINIYDVDEEIKQLQMESELKKLVKKFMSTYDRITREIICLKFLFEFFAVIRLLRTNSPIKETSSNIRYSISFHFDCMIRLLTFSIVFFLSTQT